MNTQEERIFIFKTQLKINGWNGDITIGAVIWIFKKMYEITLKKVDNTIKKTFMENEFNQFIVGLCRLWNDESKTIEEQKDVEKILWYIEAERPNLFF